MLEKQYRKAAMIRPDRLRVDLILCTDLQIFEIEKLSNKNHENTIAIYTSTLGNMHKKLDPPSLRQTRCLPQFVLHLTNKKLM